MSNSVRRPMKYRYVVDHPGHKRHGQECQIRDRYYDGERLCYEVEFADGGVADFDIQNVVIVEPGS